MPDDSAAVEATRSFLPDHLHFASRALLDVLFDTIARAKERGRFPDLGPEFDFLAFALTQSRRGFAQLAQDAWVLHETGGLRGGYFVEFGAGDGVVMSNTMLLERDYGWTGALAEPNPDFHDALRRNRRAGVFTCAVTGDGARQVVFNQTENPYFSTIDAYSGADLHQKRRVGGQRITVPAMGLTELLRQAGAPRVIDYLSIDTEGSEYDILRAFDFDAFHIRFITLEHNFTPQRRMLVDLLAAKGFQRRFPGMTKYEDWYVNTRPAP